MKDTKVHARVLTKGKKLLTKLLAFFFVLVTAGVASPAYAAYVVTVQDVGTNVVATGSGSWTLLI